MQNLTKETVIIVHGTWAAPKPDHHSWYQIPDKEQDKPNFVSKLNTALEKRGSSARCWAHCNDNSEIFAWSGQNAWIDRTRASLDLAASINKLQADGWRCHVVAHSHGGNVVAEALPAVTQTIGQPSGINGTITTLGTPFIDAMSPIARKIIFRQKILNVLAWVAFPAFLLYLAYNFKSVYQDTENVTMFPEFWNGLLILFCWLCGGMSLLAMFIYILRGGRKHFGWQEYWSSFKKQLLLRPFILCLSSSMDEAWQLLHHVRAIRNPLAPKSDLISYLWRSEGGYLRTSCDIARIQGVSLFVGQSIPVKFFVIVVWSVLVFVSIVIMHASTFLTPGDKLILIFALAVFLFWCVTLLTFVFGTAFYSAILAPIRWLWRQLRAAGRLFNHIVTYVARRRSWSLLQEIALGLESYSFELPQAEREPTFACKTIYGYEDLPKNVEQRSLVKREEWIRRNFGDVTQTFSKGVVTATDLSSLLEKIETDLSLVHAAYYTDDECIERIADWIAGKAQTIEIEGAPTDTVHLAS